MSDKDTRESTELIAPENKPWLPPLSPKDQKKLDHLQKKGPPRWTGFAHKTFWDWLQLLIIPIILAAGATWFNFTQSQISLQNSQKQHDTDTQIALDKQRQEALVTYQKDISDLLLIHHLHFSGVDDEVRSVARARTLSTLRILDSGRKGLLIQFLYEARLIAAKNPVISLDGADLSYANLPKVHLRADLSYTNLRGSNLSEAFLYIANLSHTDLSDANLRGADLDEANLDGANLRGADLRGAKLMKANLAGANLSDANLREAYLYSTGLYTANLSKANLSYATLNKANLSEATLSSANLSGADLSYATLNKANLTLANLTLANLTLANLSEARLFRANLNFANLNFANLSHSDLSRADLRNADLDYPDLSGANLKGAINTTTEQLDKAKSLQGATMPDGTIHP